MMKKIKSVKSTAARLSKRRAEEVGMSVLLNNLLCQMWIGKRFASCLSLLFLVVGVLMCESVLPVQAEARSRSGYAREKKLRKITVADCIRLVRFGDPLYTNGGTPTHIASFSPDGKFFTIVVRRGNIENNTIVYSLLLFTIGDTGRSSQPRILLSWAASSNRDAIRDVSWLSDNNTLLFLGASGRRTTQLYTIERVSGKVINLSHYSTDVTAYTSTPNGESIAFEVQQPSVSFLTESAERNGIAVSTQLISDLLEGRSNGSEGVAGAQDHRVFFRRRGSEQSEPLVPHGKMYAPPTGALWLSPNGRYCILRTEIDEIPGTWARYREKYIAEAVRGGVSGLLQHYEIIDTHSGVSETLMFSPVSVLGSELIWASDSRSVVISGTYLPLDIADAQELEARASNAFAVEIEIPSRRIRKITAAPLRVLRWDANSDLLFEQREQADRDGASILFRFRKTRLGWELAPTGNSHSSLPTILLSEDMNTPPRFMMVDQVTNKQALLYDPNPQFNEFRLGKVKEVTWNDQDGHKITGGLYFPPDYSPGQRYPLVIQTHGFNPRRFWVDGPWTTAFAAQPLAAKEFMVLQVPDPDYAIMGTSEEPLQALSSLESAIDYLDGLDLIDRNRVGIIGFSRTCFYVKYALTHSKYRIAAAAVADGVDMGYWQYLALSNIDPSYGSQVERFYGAKPFGSGLLAWQKLSPGFGMDRVEAPLRIQAFHGIGLIWEWEWFAGLSRLRKPVDMVYLPGGIHVLQKPWDRLVSQEGNVDWFDFWLNGHEDPNPAKAEQYQRWRELRKLQEENEEKSPAATN